MSVFSSAVATLLANPATSSSALRILGHSNAAATTVATYLALMERPGANIPAIVQSILAVPNFASLNVTGAVEALVDTPAAQLSSAIGAIEDKIAAGSKNVFSSFL